MIYLIFTTSIVNHYGASSKRVEQYQHAILKTLSYLPSIIQPIIVENNGDRSTFLDHFLHDNKRVPVYYTDHNETRHSKGVKELLDIQYVIRQHGIQDDDFIIKVTGRYYATCSSFFQEIIDDQEQYDSFIKFYDVCRLRFDSNESVLGCYAMRAYLLLLWHPTSIDLSRSAEVAFAKYARYSGGHIKEMKTLGIMCVFAEDNRHLEV